MKTCWFIKETAPKITLLYVHVFGSEEYNNLAIRFMSTYKAYPPEFDHRVVVICNKGRFSNATREFFAQIPNVTFYNHNNDGQDIGAYISYAKTTSATALFCCGATTHFRRKGWLAKTVDAWNQYGPGMYGTLATYEVSPHFCTTGFLIAPEILAAYPLPVITKENRYDFEHGSNSCVRMCIRAGIPARLVTWNGIYDWKEWRTPENIYSRGDQSACLTYFRHSDSYEQSSEPEKARRRSLADPLTNPLL